MIHLRAAKGLGDALHLRAVALHLIERGHRVTVYSDWADVLCDLPIAVAPLARSVPDARTVCYSLSRPLDPGADKFVMSCRKAGIEEPVELRINWRVRNEGLVRSVRKRAGGRRVLVYQPQRRTHSALEDIVSPQHDAFREHLAGRSDAFRVRVGRTPFVHGGMELPCDLDLVDQMSVSDAIDLGAAADEFFCEPCYLLVLGEALRKPVTCMFSARAMREQGKARNYTPDRFLHRRESVAIFDEATHAVA